MKAEKVRENYTPNFSGYSRSVFNYNKTGNLRYKNDTWAVRPNVSYWKRLIKFISEKYKDAPSVNVYDYACSVGHEAYTFIMAMFSSNYEKNPEKYMPVIAKDFDKRVIEAAKRQEFSLDIIEKNDLQQLIGKKNPLDEFLFIDDKLEHEYGYNTYLMKKLVDNVKFFKADIIRDTKNIEPDNSIVFARNFWPYLKDGDRVKLAQSLYNHLGTNSMVITGRYDEYGKTLPRREAAGRLLKTAGFKSSRKIEHVFEKII